jgi:hypothetical protein
VNTAPGCPTCRSVVGVVRLRDSKKKKDFGRVPNDATLQCDFCGLIGTREELKIVEIKSEREQREIEARDRI